jgi:hypothetical protein
LICRRTFEATKIASTPEKVRPAAPFDEIDQLQAEYLWKRVGLVKVKAAAPRSFSGMEFVWRACVRIDPARWSLAQDLLEGSQLHLDLNTARARAISQSLRYKFVDSAILDGLEARLASIFIAERCDLVERTCIVFPNRITQDDSHAGLAFYHHLVQRYEFSYAKTATSLS